MNYNEFMRKLDGRKSNDTTNRTTETPRALDLQGIIRFALGFGYSEQGLAQRSNVPDLREASFWAGFDGRPALGVYGDGTGIFYRLGVLYKLSFGDTPSEQQDTVSPEATREYAGSDGLASRVNEYERRYGRSYRLDTSDRG